MLDDLRVIGAFAICLGLVACDGRRGPDQGDVKPDYQTEAVIKTGASADWEFFPGSKYNPKISKPADVIGHGVGAKPASHGEILDCFKRWAKESPRVTLEKYAKSHEGRDLVRVVITSEINQGKLDDIKSNLGRLADPRGLSDGEARKIIDSTPPVAFLGFSIHGDELSGADASLAVGYHLIAGIDEAVTKTLDNLVVVVDPVMNPDGRQRIISQIEQNAGFVPNLDYSSMHRGSWPWGRGNHYLFDMNRDWFAGVAPETRGRWKNMLEFHPQLVVDVHEMMPLDTYLFYPASKPHNPHRPPHVAKWHKELADNHAALFDSLGMSYYTREWVEGWYPGYTDAWSAMNSAVGMLYEQARYAGQSLRRPSGEVVTYFQSVHAQAISCMSDLKTLELNRTAVLEDYLKGRQLPLGGSRAFAIRTGKTPDREREFITNMRRQGVEVFRADEEFFVGSSVGTLQNDAGKQTFPVGSYIIQENQPQGLLIRALLNFDIRYDKSILEKERFEIERKGESKIYDSTAWNIAQLHDLDGYWIDTPKVRQTLVGDLTGPQPGVVKPDPKAVAYAWIVDGRNDTSIAFAVQAMELDVKIRIADKEFTSEGQSFPKGTLLIRSAENSADVETRLEQAAKKSGVQVIATLSGRSKDEGPDLGGGHFSLLHRPRVAVLTNSPVSTSEYGHVWHHLDRDVKISFTMIDAQHFGRYDLRRYNVLVIPPAGQMLQAILKPHAEKLKAWIRGGGTLIAMGSSAAIMTSEGIELGSVKLRRDVLLDLDNYKKAALRDVASRNIEIDVSTVWGDARKSDQKSQDKNGQNQVEKKKDEKLLAPAAKSEDEWKRLFAPRGAILRGLVNVDSWLTYGMEAEMPVLMNGDFVYMAKPPASVPIRFAPIADLRLGGLLWPEASERIAMSAYVSLEQFGQGQIIYFANSPCFRGHTKGTARLLSNAVVYGPSVGARQPLVW